MSHLGHRLAALAFHWRAPRVTRDELVDFQNRQLRRLVHHAYTHVAYYRRLFDRHGLKPQDIRVVNDLGRVPITTKQDLQNLPLGEIVARNVDPRKLIGRDSSGSSGRPFTVWRSWWEERQLGAFRMRARRSYGLRATDRHCFVVEDEPLQRADNQVLLKLMQFLGCFRRTVVNCTKPPEQIARELCEIQPDVVTGYAMTMAQVARHLDPGKWRGHPPRFVCTGAEVLTPAMRRQIAKGFGAPVYNTYGSIEFNLLAWECPQSGELHTCDDGMILEVVDDGRSVGKGECGEVVGTNLHSFAMPLIRFRLGDIVTKGRDTCACGQPFSTIQLVAGRTIDYFHLPDGRLLHPYEFYNVHEEHMPWIREFQVTQESVDRVVMRVVPTTTPTAEQLATAQRASARFFGPAVTFELALVPDIPLEASGKFRAYRCLIQSAGDVL